MAPAGRTVRDGLVVGLIAYAAVAVFYAAFDVLAARGTLFTVNLLGQAVFNGLRDPSVLEMPIVPDLKVVAMYNAFHFVASLAIGLVVVGLVAHAERKPSQARLAFATIVAGFFVTIAAVGSLTSPMRAVLPWWSIVVANASAVVVAGAYLLRRRPGTWQRLSPFGS